MFKTRRHPRTLAALAAALLLAGAVAGRALAADAGPTTPPPEREKKLIETLQTNSAPGDKAIACKQLAIYGGKDAIPALANLLPNPELSSWARIALEAIPDPAADDALRAALDKADPLIQIGLINSLGVRRDARSVDAIAAKFKGADAEVAGAAAAALGKIGGDAAAKVLGDALASGPEALRPAAAEGCVLVAERYMRDGKGDVAAKIYDAVRGAKVPPQRLLEAMRGSILARQAAGVPLLIEQLHSPDKASFNMALRVARELPLPEVGEALAAEIGKVNAERLPGILLALADRRDAKALPAAIDAAKSASPAFVRLAAVAVLEQIGNASAVPVLIDAAAGDDAALAAAAQTALARLIAPDVDAAVIARLEQKPAGKAQQILIELTARRRLFGALPLLAKAAEDADPTVRAAAVDAISLIGDDKQAATLARLLEKSSDPKDRESLEKALMGVGSRFGSATVSHLLPLARHANPINRMSALHALVSCGGAEALSALTAAIGDTEAAVSDEAVRTLSTWPNRWPNDAAAADALLTLAKSPKKPAHGILALRGYFRFVQDAKELKPDDRLARAQAALPLATRPEEKRVAIPAIAAIGSAKAVDAVLAIATADPTVAEESYAAIVSVAAKNPGGIPKDVLRKSLQTVVEQTKNDVTKKKASDLLKK